MSEVLERAEKSGITWPIDLSAKQLVSLPHPPTGQKKTPPEPDREAIFYEMKKKSVMLMFLWEEYKAKHSDGVMYTQFCERYRNFKKQNQLTIHIEHKGGEEVPEDWAGQTLRYTDPETGEVKETSIFVAVLPVSAYPFVHAYEDMKLANWLDAHASVYEYFSGVPKVTIPDNAKTAVTTADRVDPVLNKSSVNSCVITAQPSFPPGLASSATSRVIEIYIGNKRIAACVRNYNKFNRYSTSPEHMPEQHKAVFG